LGKWAKENDPLKGKRVKKFGKDNPLYGTNQSGDNNPHWRGGVTSSNRLERKKFRDTVQKQVFERDDYTCQMCGKRGVALQVDHIQSWKEYVELRFDINNCRTLCQSCHYQITFGRPMPDRITAWGHNLKHNLHSSTLST
jgi:5-methylcytosine-specific restriction endonuclease McrA